MLTLIWHPVIFSYSTLLARISDRFPAGIGRFGEGGAITGLIELVIAAHYRTSPRAVVYFLFVALVVGGVLLSSPDRAHSQGTEDPTYEIAAVLRSGETEVPKGASVVFRVTRTGDTSEGHAIRFYTAELYRLSRGSPNDNVLPHWAVFLPGESTADVRVPVLGSTSTRIFHHPERIYAHFDYLEMHEDFPDPPDVPSVPIRERSDDDVFVTIAAVNETIAEGGTAEFTVTRAGATEGSLTVAVEAEDPDGAMRGNHWDDAPGALTSRKLLTFAPDETAITVSFPTRPNIRDTGDLTLAAVPEESVASNVWLGTDFRAAVTVTDDDTAPEVSLTASASRIIEGDDLTFTLTRYGDDSEAFEPRFAVTIGPDRVRSHWPYRETRTAYSAAMEPGQSSKVWPVTNSLDLRNFNFNYEATITFLHDVPEEALAEYVNVRGDRTVQVPVINLNRQVVTYGSVGGHDVVDTPGSNATVNIENARFLEGQQVPFVLVRTGHPSLLAKELVVTARYIERRNPDAIGDPVNDFANYYNPSEQTQVLTFPPGETEVSGTFEVSVDDFDDNALSDNDPWWDIAALSVDRVAYSSFFPRFDGWNPGGIQGNYFYLAIHLRDSDRAVYIEAVDTDGDEDEPPTIAEGESAEFTLTRLGPTTGGLTVDVAIDDPGDFRRGNHWRSTPDDTVRATFAAGSTTTTLSIPTSDDWRDIPDNTITATISPSQDGSYRPANSSEGAASASFKVTDNDIASVVSLSVSAEEVVEGTTATFTVTRENTDNTVLMPLLLGLERDWERTDYTFAAGVSELSIAIETDDDDYDDPAVQTYYLSLPALDRVPADERAQYWTVEGDSEVSIAVTDNDLPELRVLPFRDEEQEGSTATFRIVIRGQRTEGLNAQYEWYELANPSEGDNTEVPLGTGEATFTADSRWVWVTVDIPEDSIDEGDGVIGLRVQPNTASYRLGSDHDFGHVRVLDDDPEPALAVSTAPVSEGDDSVDFVVYFARGANRQSKRTITVDYATHGRSARPGEDYVSQSGTLTIGPDETNGLISVPLLDDKIAEGQELFILSVRNPTHATLQDGADQLRYFGTILDDEPIVWLAPVESEITEGEDIRLRATRTGDTTEALTVYLQVGYWGGDSGFVGPVNNQTLEIPAGQSSAVWTVATEDDDVYELDEQFMGWLPPVGLVWRPDTYLPRPLQAIVTVKDDDLPSVTIEATRERVFEAFSPSFELKRNGYLGESLTVNVSGTRTGEFFADDSNLPTTATFGAGESSATLTVATEGDSTEEDHGSVSLSIADPSDDGDQYAPGAPSSATVQILDDDGTGPSISITPVDVAVDEGENVQFLLTRTTSDTQSELTVRVVEYRYSLYRIGQDIRNSVWDDRPDQRAEYEHYRSGLFSDEQHEVTFAAGSPTVTLTIPTEDEEYNDGNSYFKATVPLSRAYRVSPSTSVATVWVRDDDIPTVNIAPEAPSRVEEQLPDSKKARRYDYTLSRTGNTDTRLAVDMAFRTGWRFEVGLRQFPETGMWEEDWTIGGGESSTDYHIQLHFAPIRGAYEYREIRPVYCEEVPGDCGLRPQYRLGENTSYTFELLNNALGVSIVPDRTSIAEGESVTFTIQRFGGTPEPRVHDLRMGIVVTESKEFIDGTPPLIAKFDGYPTVSVHEASDTTTVTINTVDDDVFEGDGYIDFMVVEAQNLNNPEAEIDLEFVGSNTVRVFVEDDEEGGISISAATASETDEYISFEVTVPATYERTTVDWATSDGTATAGEDYTAASGTLVFEVGDTSKTIRVALTDDTATEGDETFTVTLSNPTVAQLGDSSAIGTIQDNDVRESVTIINVSDGVYEGQTAGFTFTRSAVTEGDDPAPRGFGSQPLVVTATLAQTPDGSDFFDPDGDNYGDTEVDYDADTGNVTFTIPGGSLTYTLELTTDDDDRHEDPGLITLSLVQGDAYDVGDPGSASTRVFDNDAAIRVSANPTRENARNMVVFVTLDGQATEDVTVTLSTRDGSATSHDLVTDTSLGKDYTSTTQTVTFAPGATSRLVYVPITNDTLDEGVSEYLHLDLSNPSANARIETGSARALILDDDKPMVVSVHREGLTVDEDADGPIAYSLRLSPQENSRTTAAEIPTSVTWTLREGTATADADYQLGANLSRKVTIGPGVLSRNVSVNLIDDDLFEPLQETFTLELTAAEDLELDADNQSLVTTIRDDDYLRADVEAVWANVVEGDDALFRVSMTPAVSSGPTVVEYTLVGTATGADYAAPSGTLTIPAGASFGDVTITTLQDDVEDPGETLGLQLTRVMSNSREVTIFAREEPSVTTILEPGTLTASVSAGEAVDEGESLQFTARLSMAAAEQVVIEWATADGDGRAAATAGEDYTQASGSVTIAAGDTSATFTVATLDDNLYEGDETFLATISSAMLGDAQDSTTEVPITRSHGVGTITDTDEEPTGITLSVSPARVDEDAGETELTVTATLNGQSRLPDNLVVRVTAGDARGDLTVGAGQASGDLVLAFTPEDDEEYTGDRTREIAGVTTGYEVTPATLTVVDDEVLATGVTLSASPATIEEGAGETELEVTGTLTEGLPRAEDVVITLSVRGASVPSVEDGGESSEAAGSGDFHRFSRCESHHCKR